MVYIPTTCFTTSEGRIHRGWCRTTGEPPNNWDGGFQQDPSTVYYFYAG